MNNEYTIKKVNNKTIDNHQKNINNTNKKVETIDFSNEETKLKINVLKSIKNNIEGNRRVTNKFNRELYNRINQEIINLSKEEGISRHAAK